MEEQAEGKKKGGAGSVFVGLLIGLIIGVGGYWTWTYFHAASTDQLITQANAAQVKDLVAKVSKLIVLPTGEDPIVATINDASALIKQQAFYTGAVNGDVVLVYQKAAKAIVYSPSRNIIVNVGPVFQQPASSTAAVASSSSK